MRAVAATAALAGAALLAGCGDFDITFGTISATYAALTPQVVTIGCNDPYEVYDRRESHRFLIVSNGFREIAGCGARDDLGGDPAATRRARFREAAETYLRETRREACRIATENAFTDLHTEFTYSCPGPDRPGAPVVRLPGRQTPRVGR